MEEKETPVIMDGNIGDGDAETELINKNDTISEKQSVDAQEDTLQTESELWNTESAELDEINALCGTEFASLEEMPRYRRYRELRENGGLSVEEALYASNLGKLPRSASYAQNSHASENGGDEYVRQSAERKTRTADNREHLSSSRNKGSNGEVFTKADKDELALWGITSTGAELERLWRNAGMQDMR